MISNLYFCILSAFYSLMLLIICKRKTNDTLKHHIFKLLVLTNFIGIIIGFACFYTVLNYQILPMTNYIVSRLYLVYLLIWIILFTLYIFTISYNFDYKSKNYIKVKKVMMILFIIFTILIFILPLNYVNTDSKVYSYGPSAKMIYALSEALTLIGILSMFKNAKKIDVKKYSPLFIFIAGGILVMLIQSVYPELLLITSMEVFVTYMIYFSMENDFNKKAVQKLEEEKK